MKFACPKCRTPHALADSELPVGRTFRFVCGNCGHTLGVRRKDDSAAAPANEAAPQGEPAAKAGSTPAQAAMPAPHGASPIQQQAQLNQAQQQAQATTAHQAQTTTAHQAAPTSLANPAPQSSTHHSAPAAGAPHPAPPAAPMPQASAAQPPRPASAPQQHAPGMPPAAAEPQMSSPAAARPPPAAGTPPHAQGAPAAGTPPHAQGAPAAGTPPHAQGAPIVAGTAGTDTQPPGARHANLATPMQGAPQPAPAGAAGSQSAPQPANKVQVVANHAVTPAAPATPSNKPPAPVQLNPFAEAKPSAAPGGKRPSKAQAAASAGGDADDDLDDDLDEDIDTDFDAPGTEADLGGLGDDDLADLEHMPSEPNFLSAEEQAYVEAAPGQATQLFMQTAGIYKRRKRLRVAAWSIGGSLIAICALVTADVTGLVSLPVMGAVYDAAGMQDPDAHRGIERAKSQLTSASLTSAQREELRHKLMGYDADVPAPAPPPRHRTPERKALEPPVPAAQVFSKIDKVLDEAPRGEAAGTQAPAQAAADAAPVAGELSPEAITRVVKANSHGLTTCINDAMRKGGNISGTLEVQVVILPSGEVKEAQIETERFRNTPLGHCAIKRVKGWRFPRFNAEPMTVVFPYVLSGGG